MWIYKITNKFNGKIYVGKTYNLEQRWAQHRQGRHTGGAIKRAFKKWGKDAFNFEVIEEGVKTEGELNRLEMFWIEKLGSHGTKHGYNMTLGGEGTRFSEEMRAKRSGPNAWMYGKRHTAEARAKMSAQRKGRPKTPKQLAAAKAAGERRKGRPFSPEHRARIAAGKRGTKHSPETLAKLKRPKSPEHRAKLLVAFRKRSTARIIEYNGAQLNISDWAKKIGMSCTGLADRLDRQGWSVEKALTTPVGRWSRSRCQLVLPL